MKFTVCILVLVFPPSGDHVSCMKQTTHKAQQTTNNHQSINQSTSPKWILHNHHQQQQLLHHHHQSSIDATSITCPSPTTFTSGSTTPSTHVSSVPSSVPPRAFVPFATFTYRKRRWKHFGPICTKNRHCLRRQPHLLRKMQQSQVRLRLRQRPLDHSKGSILLRRVHYRMVCDMPSMPPCSSVRSVPLMVCCGVMRCSTITTTMINHRSHRHPC